MLRSLLRLSGAVALAALVSPLAPSAAPAPGIAYDEIVRVVVGATPPPPGNFQADVAALSAPIASATATPAPKRRGLGLGALAGAVLGGGGAGAIGGAVAGDAASNATDNMMQNALGGQFAALGAAMRGFLQPHLMHYAFYNGWERVDDIATQTATIRKCDIGQVYKLDLAKKTYSVSDPSSEPTPPAAPPPSRSGRSAPAAQAPGTAVAVISATTKALGPARIENLATNGYTSTSSFVTTQSTGSCHDGSVSIKTEEYLSALNRPAVTSCPVRRAPVPQSATEAIAPQSSGGCRPTLSYRSSGPPLPTSKLSLYTLVTMNGASGATPAPSASGTPGIAFLTERGDIKSLGATSAALFSVPADFTKTP